MLTFNRINSWILYLPVEENRVLSRKFIFPSFLAQAFLVDNVKFKILYCFPGGEMR